MLFLLYVKNRSLLGERFDLALRRFHKGCHICFGENTMLIEELKLRPELLKAHDLLTHFSCNSGRVLLLFNFAKDVEVVVIQSQKAGILRVLLVGLVRLTMNNSTLVLWAMVSLDKYRLNFTAFRVHELLSKYKLII